MGVGRGVEIDKLAAREHCDNAIASASPESGSVFLHNFLGLRVSYLPAEASFNELEVCRIHFEVRDIFLNMNGVLHGGVIATVLDTSMGHLVHKVMGPNLEVGGATIEMKAQYLRPLTAGEAMAEARFLRRGRNISFLESKLWTDDGKLAAAATGTFKMPVAG